MRKYYYFFRMRFATGLQYRMAAVTALTTQFVWGLMECLAYKALLESNAIKAPMDYSALVSYIWLKEAFLALFNTWAADNDIFTMIMDGGIAYELCRPLSVYKMWFARTIGGRMSEALLRCIPVLLCACLLPSPYKMGAPASIYCFIIFFITMLLALGVTVSFCMLIYILCFFTVSPNGWRIFFMGAVDLLAGMVVPIPFIPQPYRTVIEYLPFASMSNVPFRIYSGDLQGMEMCNAIVLQVFWLFALIGLGSFICRMAQRRVVIQGG